MLGHADEPPNGGKGDWTGGGLVDKPARLPLGDGLCPAGEEDDQPSGEEVLLFKLESVTVWFGDERNGGGALVFDGAGVGLIGGGCLKMPSSSPATTNWPG